MTAISRPMRYTNIKLSSIIIQEGKEQCFVMAKGSRPRTRDQKPVDLYINAFRDQADIMMKIPPESVVTIFGQFIENRTNSGKVWRNFKVLSIESVQTPGKLPEINQEVVF